MDRTGQDRTGTRLEIGKWTEKHRTGSDMDRTGHGQDRTGTGQYKTVTSDTVQERTETGFNRI